MGDSGEKTTAVIISRLAMMVMAVALIIGGMKCLHLSALTATEDFNGSLLLLKIGWGLVAAGTLCLVGSLFPAAVVGRLVDRFTGPPE